jgi:LacI family sucrose operon transcriptional repressor
MKVTIIDIANIAGVGTSTVSRFLNGGYVSDISREKIEKAIKETNYKPNNFAQHLKGKRSNLIGIIVPRLDSFSVSKMLNGIDEILKKHSMHMLIHTSQQALDREIESLYSLATQKVAGIVLLATKITEQHLETLHNIKVPCMLIGQQHPMFPYVIQDDYHAAYTMGQHIISQGHTQIAYFGVSEMDEAVGIYRKQGFMQAMQEHGIESILSVETSFSIDDAEQNALDFLMNNKHSSPSIIACATDNIALGVMKAAGTLGLSIPKQLSITGFGGYDVSQIVQPHLTTIKFDYKDTGIHAATNLIEWIDKRVSSPPCHTMSYELLMKESVDNKNECAKI